MLCQKPGAKNVNISNWICKNIPLENVTVCTQTISKAFLTGPKRHKIHQKEKRKENEERGDRKTDSGRENTETRQNGENRQNFRRNLFENPVKWEVLVIQ